MVIEYPFDNPIRESLKNVQTNLDWCIHSFRNLHLPIASPLPH